MRTILPIQRALVSIETAKAVLNKGEDAVLQLIEAGKLRFAFDLGQTGSHRRTIRIFTLSLYDYVNRQDTQPAKVDDCIKYILPMPLPSVAGVRLAEILNISSSHVSGLVEGGELKEIPNRQRSCTSSRSICRASVIQFLKDRRCV